MGVGGAMPNNLRIPQAMSNGVPQAQMQGLPMNHSLTPELADGARRVSMQQRQQQLHNNLAQQHGSPHPGQAQNSPPRMNGMPTQPGFMSNNMTSYNNNNNVNGMAGSPGVSAPPPAQAGSPRVSLPPSVPPIGAAASPPYLDISQRVRRNNPNTPEAEVLRLIGSEVIAYNNSNNKHLHQRGLVQPSGIAASAMNAAAGNNNLGINGQGGQRPPIGIQHVANVASPQMYAQQMSMHHQRNQPIQQPHRQQQQQQQQQNHQPQQQPQQNQQQQHAQATVSQGQGNNAGAPQNGGK